MIKFNGRRLLLLWVVAECEITEALRHKVLNFVTQCNCITMMSNVAETAISTYKVQKPVSVVILTKLTALRIVFLWKININTNVGLGYVKSEWRASTHIYYIRRLSRAHRSESGFVKCEPTNNFYRDVCLKTLYWYPKLILDTFVQNKSSYHLNTQLYLLTIAMKEGKGTSIQQMKNRKPVMT